MTLPVEIVLLLGLEGGWVDRWEGRLQAGGGGLVSGAHRLSGRIGRVCSVHVLLLLSCQAERRDGKAASCVITMEAENCLDFALRGVWRGSVESCGCAPANHHPQGFGQVGPAGGSSGSRLGGCCGTQVSFHATSPTKTIGPRHLGLSPHGASTPGTLGFVHASRI